MSQMSQSQQTTSQSQQSGEDVPTFPRHSNCAICGSGVDVLWARETSYGTVQRVVCSHGHWYDRPA
jgi:hypothetical protein